MRTLQPIFGHASKWLQALTLILRNDAESLLHVNGLDRAHFVPMRHAIELRPCSDELWPEGGGDELSRRALFSVLIDIHGLAFNHLERSRSQQVRGEQSSGVGESNSPAN